jgi:uncharacterized protein with HEPN domain
MSHYDVYINLILEMISKIEKDSEKSLDDDTVWDATLMRFQVIGESVDKLPDDIKKKHQEVNWRKFYKFRNSISHEYAEVPQTIILNLMREIPNLKKAVQQITREIK